MKKLDREKLGIKIFWKEFRIATRDKEKVLIFTHKKEISSVQIDLKLLMKSTIKNQGPKAVVGFTPNQVKIILGVLQWMIILTLSVVVIYSISKKYKFKITRDKDGNIVIEGEPA